MSSGYLPCKAAYGKPTFRWPSLSSSSRNWLSSLLTRANMALETLAYSPLSNLTRLLAREHLIELTRRESFKLYYIQNTHSVGLPWKGDRPVAETSTCQHTSYFQPTGKTSSRVHTRPTDLQDETSPVKVKQLTHAPAPRHHALLPVLPPRHGFPFSCTLSVDGIKSCLFPCGNTVFTGSDLDGTNFVPATYSRRPRQLTAADTLR
jgi:hypothetical protein